MTFVTEAQIKMLATRVSPVLPNFINHQLFGLYVSCAVPDSSTLGFKTWTSRKHIGCSLILWFGEWWLWLS
ncbi:MAG: hypothetical protein K5Q00_00470, partial [Gammaproteobacteria bacterium]|nr:hypothetical protein [Gammaproteobacteria bacterium]